MKINKIKIIKSLDKTIGSHIISILPNKKTANAKTVNSILIIRPGGIGDAILLIPMIKKLKETFPDANIDILAEKRNAEAFKLFACNCNIFRYDAPMEFIHILKHKKYDLVFDTEQWHILSSLIARYVGEFVVGFDTNERRKNLDIKVCYSHTEYEVESFLNLLEEYCKYAGLNFNRKWNYPFLNIQHNDFLYDIIISTGASIEYRKWDINKYIKLINKLNELNLKIAIIGAKIDMDFNKKIEENCQVDNYTGKTSLRETAKLISSSKLLFSTDSGILHIGAGLGIKTISLFGPGIEYKWAPQGKNHKTINRYLPCSPCTRFGYTPRCPYHLSCLKQLNVDKAMESIKFLLFSN